jgi:hypothetical protein
VLLYFGRTRVLRLTRDAARAFESTRSATLVAAGACVWALVAGIVFGTYAIGGADSYGYVGQARLLARGQLTDTIPVSREYTWPDPDVTFTPLGFTIGRTRGVIAPKYPPGLPLLMAPFTLLPERTVYFLVPFFGALLVWTTYRLGVRIGEPLAGALSAVLLSVSPTFLYQVVQPMSDVPAAACWLGALLLASRATVASAALAALISGMAVLIRPNLAPLAAIVVAVAVFSGDVSGTRWKAPFNRMLAFCAALAPAVVALAWIQYVRYGSATASGYGSISDAFAFAYIRENLVRYPRWITETHTWFIWLSIAAPLWIVRRARYSILAWGAAALAVAVWASYLPYVYFQPHEWFYTRFLLPAVAIMLLFAAAVLLWVLRPLPSIARVPIALAAIVFLAVTCLGAARTHGAFDIRSQERKYPLAGHFVRERLPEKSIVLAAQHSGSIRYYAGRPTFRWDLLSPTRLDQALATFRAQGYEPFLVVDGGEYEEFKARFDATGQLASQRTELLAILGDARIYSLGERRIPNP